MRPVLVVGATGLLGSEICRLLRGSEHEVRGLVRPGSPREEYLRRLGVETVPGDLRDAGSLERACQGVETVVSTATAVRPRLPGDTIKSVDRDGQQALVEAARQEGVRRFVYVSVSPNFPRATPLVCFKREVERSVRSAGMGWVIVQPSVFMETRFSPTAGFDAAQGKALVVGSGEVPVSYVSYRDVAKVASGAARAGSRVRWTYVPIGGPEPVATMDVLRSFEEVTGRSFQILRVPPGLARGIGFVAQPFHSGLASVLSLGAHLAHHGDWVESTETARRLVPHPVSIQDFVRDESRTAVVKRVRVLLRGAGGTRL